MNPSTILFMLISTLFLSNCSLPSPPAELTRIPFKEHRIPTQKSESKIYAREYPKNGPTVFLLHGFPDNLHLYDYLIPQLVSDHHLIVFDFLGWGRSDKPKDYPYTAIDQRHEVEAVANYFNPQNLSLVLHDSSGPPGINYALDNPSKINRLVLLNTYYSPMPFRKPGAIWLFSTDGVRQIAKVVSKTPINRLIYNAQVGSFIGNAERRANLLPRLFQPFKKNANRRAFILLNADLDKEIARNSLRTSELSKLGSKSLIIFGEQDRNLNPKVAREFQHLLPESRLHLISEAKHYVQVDAPEKVAALIRHELKN